MTGHHNSEVFRADRFGVLKLDLYPDHYAWAFLPVSEESPFDAGTERLLRWIHEEWPRDGQSKNFYNKMTVAIQLFGHPSFSKIAARHLAII